MNVTGILIVLFIAFAALYLDLRFNFGDEK